MSRLSDDDDWNESGFQADDDTGETIPCPYCRKDVYEGAEQCPHCRQYLSSEDAPVSQKPWWIVAGAIVCLFVTYFWVMHR